MEKGGTRQGGSPGRHFANLGGMMMKIGDIVTRKVYGEDMQFCILGFYTNQETGERVAILALLDPSLIMEAAVQELAPVSARHLFALTTTTSTQVH